MSLLIREYGSSFITGCGVQIPMETYLAHRLLLLLLLPRVICFHGTSVLFDGHFFLSCWHFLSVCLSCSPAISPSPLPHHQSFQVMLSSLHSELDIQSFLMKIQSSHRVSHFPPFFTLFTCILLRIVADVCVFRNLINSSLLPDLAAKPPVAP